MIGIFRLSLIALACFVFAGCGLTPEKISLSDPRIAPILSAMAAVDRQSLGFTTIAANSDVRIEWGPGHGYDVMLHVYAESSRTIAFKKAVNGAYTWIGEQEIHRGPKIYETEDGRFNEEIVISYETEQISGIPLGQPHITYSGEDLRLAWPKKLSLNQVQEVMQEWKSQQNSKS